jgi:hypothetical protein
MPVTPPPDLVAPASADGYRLPSGLIERERRRWVVPVRPAPRAAEPCPAAKGSEIVVCARREDDPARDRMGAPIPDAPTAMQVLNRKMHVRIGPAEIHPASGKGVEGEAVVGVTVRIKF